MEVPSRVDGACCGFGVVPSAEALLPPRQARRGAGSSGGEVVQKLRLYRDKLGRGQTGGARQGHRPSKSREPMSHRDSIAPCRACLGWSRAFALHPLHI